VHLALCAFPIGILLIPYATILLSRHILIDILIQTHIRINSLHDQPNQPKELPTPTNPTTTHQPADMSRRRMWLGNLDHDITIEDLAIILSGNGEIVWLDITRGRFGTEADVMYV